MTTYKNHDTKVSENLTLQFTAEHDESGERLCTCGSGVPAVKCNGINGDISYCG